MDERSIGTDEFVKHMLILFLFPLQFQVILNCKESRCVFLREMWLRTKKCANGKVF